MTRRQELTAVFEAFVRVEHGGGALVAPTHQLKEQHAAGAGDGQIPDFVDDEEHRVGEGLEAVGQPACHLGLPSKVMRSATVP
jgi:hypothetical protein